MAGACVSVRWVRITPGSARSVTATSTAAGVRRPSWRRCRRSGVAGQQIARRCAMPRASAARSRRPASCRLAAGRTRRRSTRRRLVAAGERAFGELVIDACARPAPPARRGREIGAGASSPATKRNGCSGPAVTISPVLSRKASRGLAVALGLHLDRDERRILDRDVELLDRRDQHERCRRARAAGSSRTAAPSPAGRSATPGGTTSRRARSASRCRRNASGCQCRPAAGAGPRPVARFRRGERGEVGRRRHRHARRARRARPGSASPCDVGHDQPRRAGTVAAREQAARLERAGQAPPAGAVGGEAEEAAVIFGVADQHQRRVGRLGRLQQLGHQPRGRARRAAARAPPRPGRPESSASARPRHPPARPASTGSSRPTHRPSNTARLRSGNALHPSRRR